MRQLELEIIYYLIPNLGTFQEASKGLFLVLYKQYRLHYNGGTPRNSQRIVIIISYRYQLIGWYQSVISQGKPLLFRRLQSLVILITYIMAIITGFGIVNITTNLSLVRVLLLRSPFLRLLAITTIIYPYQLDYCLLLLLLLLCLLFPVLTII